MTAERLVTGSCFCEAVRFAVRLPTLFCVHCHCTMCRRAHGAAFVTWYGIPTDQLTIEAGEEELVRRPSSDHGTRSFCRGCGTNLFFESTRRPEHVDVVLASMHDPIDRAPEAHVFFDDRAPWVQIDDALPRLGGPTGMDQITEEAS